MGHAILSTATRSTSYRGSDIGSSTFLASAICSRSAISSFVGASRASLASASCDWRRSISPSIWRMSLPTKKLCQLSCCANSFHFANGRSLIPRLPAPSSHPRAADIPRSRAAACRCGRLDSGGGKRLVNAVEHWSGSSNPAFDWRALMPFQELAVANLSGTEYQPRTLRHHCLADPPHYSERPKRPGLISGGRALTNLKPDQIHRQPFCYW